MKTTRISSFILRAFLTIGCLAWGSCLNALFRTTGFGFSSNELGGVLLTTFILIAPPAIFPFLGLGWRRNIIGVLAVCAASFIMAEGFAQAQERLVVRRYGQVPTEEVFVSRWWPFHHHDIIYSPNYGWSGRD